MVTLLAHPTVSLGNSKWESNCDHNIAQIDVHQKLTFHGKSRKNVSLELKREIMMVRWSKQISVSIIVTSDWILIYYARWLYTPLIPLAPWGWNNDLLQQVSVVAKVFVWRFEKLKWKLFCSVRGEDVLQIFSDKFIYHQLFNKLETNFFRKENGIKKFYDKICLGLTMNVVMTIDEIIYAFNFIFCDDLLKQRIPFVVLDIMGLAPRRFPFHAFEQNF